MRIKRVAGRLAAAVIVGSVVTFAAAVPARAMGHSKDPKEAPQPMGTEADPAIRATEQNLQQLLFQPDKTASGTTAVSEPTPIAPDKPAGSAR